MRTITEIPDYYMLLAVSGEWVKGLCRGLEQTTYLTRGSFSDAGF
jgi:hypothetical protein